MRKKSDNSTTMYCFSPPVMLATFLIEITFAAWIVWRYHMSTIARLVVAILVFLAAFQATEFLLCGGMVLEGGTWSRIGYATITVLPPLGLHLAHQLANKKAGKLVAASYVTGAMFIAYFAFFTQAISGHTCYANYAVFNTASGLTNWYTLYYYGWMSIGTFLAWKWAPTLETNRRHALYALFAGYLALFIPTTLVNIIDQSTMAGIPSIMCGFAVILAFLLATKVAPNSLDAKSERAFFAHIRN